MRASNHLSLRECKGGNLQNHIFLGAVLNVFQFVVVRRRVIALPIRHSPDKRDSYKIKMGVCSKRLFDAKEGLAN